MLHYEKLTMHNRN